MNRIRKATFIAAAGLWLLALFGGLWFAGVFSFGYRNDSDGAAEKLTAEGENAEDRVWEVVYKGMKFFLPQKGVVGVHESDCLNIRQDERYLIQIVIRDETVDERYGRWSDSREVLIEDGYRIEKEAERLAGEESDHVRYVISLEKAQGDYLERTYFEVILAPADEGRCFLAMIRYDKIDMEKLDETMREKLYEEALVRTSAILAGTCPTDELDDELGTYWWEDKNLAPEHEYISEDTIVYRDGQYSLSYQLPEHCMLTTDNIAGKTYYDEDNQVYVTTNVLKYSWRTAKYSAESLAERELSRPHSAGEAQVSGRTFYYCTYTVCEYNGNKKSTVYEFYGYCDLEDGSVYSIRGYSEICPETLDPEYYFEWMNITVS